MLKQVLLILMCSASAIQVWAVDIDVTYIDRLPNYSYDAEKNRPAAGDSVTFVAHITLVEAQTTLSDYAWFLDGMAMEEGTLTLEPGQDNTLRMDWIWDDVRHEIMIVLDPANLISEDSEHNNILYDFTDALIVGMRVELGLVEAFHDFQIPLGIGSMGFEDWAQRQIKIWNLVLMNTAGELSSDRTADLQDRVRLLLTYHEDGTLAWGNCPLEWKEVDMLWGKLASDISFYEDNPLNWLYEGSLPHELNHARYVPDTYVYGVPTWAVEIVDDSGLPVTETEYMPPYSWGDVYTTDQQGMMSGDYRNRYDLFSAYVLNRIAGERACGCNTNGCCWGSQHESDIWPELPDSMFLRLTRMDGTPWVGARLDCYRRIGYYNDQRVDNIVDHTTWTDGAGRALLPSVTFGGVECGLIVLKITAPDGEQREYRFLERPAFHIACWSGSCDAYEYVIKTEFAPVPYAETVSNVWGHLRGETLQLVFSGSGFQEGCDIRFANAGIVVESIEFVDSSEVRVTITLPEDLPSGGVGFKMINPDGKFSRISDPYESAIQIDLANDSRPYARFVPFNVEDRLPGGYYFNGLWSDDWGPLYWRGSYPQSGGGPIEEYNWDFGDGTVDTGPYVVHQYHENGEFQVTLTVWDSQGFSAMIAKDVIVESATSAIADPAEVVIPGVAPNPVVADARIVLDVPEATNAVIEIYGIDGRFVRAIEQAISQPGIHTFVWDGKDGAGEPVANGVYVFSIVAGSTKARGRLTLLR